MRYWKVALGLALVLVLPFLQGVFIEMGVEDAIHGWPTIMLYVAVPWLLALVASLALTLRHDMQLAMALVLGVTIGFAGGLFLLAGDFAPYALELRGRELADFGDTLEIEWDWLLVFLALAIGVTGALAGAVSGPAVLAVKRLLVTRAA
jgi:hypothetical protein